ncbi:hypothetical protein FACS1894160_1090 [Bacteroidia bacterium]|nr:hypothetical protein FACS1894160_1090 [Bacteroidia bacterium]
MYLKRNLNTLYVFLLTCMMTSCLNDNNSDDPIYSTDAELTSFSLAHDSVTGLKATIFTIDQVKNLIYNHDSLTYLTELRDKVVVTYTSGAGTTNLQSITDTDSTWIKSGDSINISKLFSLKVYAPDGQTTKQYALKINIHQVDPDSMQYVKIAENADFLKNDNLKIISFEGACYAYAKEDSKISIYHSTDAKTWDKSSQASIPDDLVVNGIRSSESGIYAYTETGDFYISYNALEWYKMNAEYPIVSILGFLTVTDKENEQTSGLSFIVKKDNENIFAFTPDLFGWQYGGLVPNDFPIAGFAAFNHEVMKFSRITLIGGYSVNNTLLNSVWSTQNGLYWAKVSGTINTFPPLTGASVFQYNNEFWIMNGQLSDNSFNTEVYYSIDRGNTWAIKKDKYKVPEDFQGRSFASVIVDPNDQYFYFFGGKNTDFLPEIWKGFQNKKEFIK